MYRQSPSTPPRPTVVSLLLVAVLTLPFGAAWGGAPELPRLFVDTTLPAVTGNTCTVNAGGNLEAAIDASAAADPTLSHLIVIQAGATFQPSAMNCNRCGYRRRCWGDKQP